MLQEPVLVVIVEDDFILAEMMKSGVNATDGFRCDKVFHSPVDFLSDKIDAEILLLDVMTPGMNGLDAIDLILKKYPSLSIIMNTIKDDTDTIVTALKKGAVGYIDKQSMDINMAEVLRAVSTGGAFMTPKIARIVFNSFQRTSTEFEKLSDRERDVTTAILDGLSYKLIAEKYNISINTVRMNVKNIYKKLRINSKGELFNMSRNTND